MKSRTALMMIAVMFAATGVCRADAFTGTWKLNLKKSKMAPGMSKNSTVTYSNAFPFQNKVVIDGTDAHGKPFHSEWTGRYDSSDVQLTGDPSADTRAVKRVDDHTLQFWSKKGGKVVNSGKVTVAPDGKSRTVEITGTDAKGKKFHGRMVYDKA